MKILRYNELPTPAPVKKLLTLLANDDFRSAEVKKIGNNLYRAKVDRAGRLLFSLYQYQGQRCCLALEYLPNHDYDKSRFLARGVSIDEDRIAPLEHLEVDAPVLPYVNPQHDTVNILDKVISFDTAQQEIYQLRPPFILIGSAGSGKTALSLEKLKHAQGDLLYVTQSAYLVQNSRKLYFANGYDNETQQIDFLSFHELLESIQVPPGREVTSRDFAAWFERHRHTVKLRDPHRIFEEIRGVITTHATNAAYLSRQDYLNLGVRQSIFNDDERPRVYDVFEKYLAFLQDNNLYDPNLISHAYLQRVTPRYDFLIVDEVQDLTTIQLLMVLRTLRDSGQFILCGDSNQIVHPNFFSWSKVKTLLHNNPEWQRNTDQLQILHTNYRSSQQVTELSNRILKLKQARFGSIDKESNYLVTSNSQRTGKVVFLPNQAKLLAELNSKTAKSTRYAILVMHPEQKALVRDKFQTPLVFSVQEAKGLEYDNIILFDFVHEEAKAFREISGNLSDSDLQSEQRYARAKDKQDKSLEIYKFYINALYVAVTRAVSNLYVIETEAQHPLLGLLGLRQYAESLDLDNQTSSLEEWQQEARKLELQGKREQAEEIRSRILQQQQVPWPVYDNTKLAELRAKTDKTSLLTQAEYAVLYHEWTDLDRLVKLGFKAAQFPDKCFKQLVGKHFMAYTAKTPTLVLNQCEKYGADFRNVFNFTPLMTACRLGATDLTEKLCGMGADPLLIQNMGLTAFLIALQEAMFDPQYATRKLPRLCELLMPDSVSLQVDGHLIKLDNRLGEFCLFNLAILLTYRYFGMRLWQNDALGASDFMAALEHLPESLVPARRKKRAYVSSLLAKNEAFRDGPYNRKLFRRLRNGHYIINPALLIKQGEDWLPIYQLIQLDKLMYYTEQDRVVRIQDADGRFRHVSWLEAQRYAVERFRAAHNSDPTTQNHTL